jgi:hypothetical protein
VKKVRLIQAIAASASLAMVLTACGAAAPVATPTVHIILLPTVTPGGSGGSGTTGAQPGTSGNQQAAPGGQQGAPGAMGNRSQVFGRPASGTVKSVQGGTVVLTEQNGNVVTATVSANTSYLKDTSIKVSDLKVGDQVTAVGQQGSDGSIAATRITVGEAGQMGALIGAGRGTPGAFATPGAGGQTFQRQGGTPGASTTPGTGGQRQGGNSAASGTPGATPFGGQLANAAFVTGTVQKVDGNTVTIAEANGQTRTVTVNNDTQLTSIVPATLADVKAGVEATVIGQAAADGTIAATVVQIGMLGALR